MNTKINEVLTAKSSNRPGLICAPAENLLKLRLPTAPGFQCSGLTFFDWHAAHTL